MSLWSHALPYGVKAVSSSSSGSSRLLAQWMNRIPSPHAPGLQHPLGMCTLADDVLVAAVQEQDSAELKGSSW